MGYYRRISAAVLCFCVSATGCSVPGWPGHSSGPVASDALGPAIESNSTASHWPTSPMAPSAGANPQSPSFFSMASLTRPFTAVGATIKKGAAAISPKDPVVVDNGDPLRLDNVTPPDVSLYLSFARFAERAGSFDQAAEQYQKALDLEPNNLDAMMGMAHLRDRRSQFTEATVLYQRITEQYPQNAAAWNDLGLCLARRGMLGDSLGALQTAIRLDPAKPLYRNNIAKVLVEMGRNEDALSQLVAVHGPAVGAYNLGYMLQEGGQSAAAVQYFSQALAADPNLTAASQWLRRLQAGPAPGAMPAPGAVPAQSPAVAGPRYAPVQAADVRGGLPGQFPTSAPQTGGPGPGAPAQIEYGRYREYTIPSVTPPTANEALGVPRAPSPDETLQMPVPYGQPSPGGQPAIAPAPGFLNYGNSQVATPYPPTYAIPQAR